MMSVSRVPERGGLYDQPAEVQAYVDQTRSGFMAFCERHFIRSILKEMGHRPSLKVLDVGTGPGWIITGLALARPEWEFSAVDASPLMLDAARKNAEMQGAEIQWLLGKADSIPLQSESLDLVVSHFAFSEFPDGKIAIQEMARVLKPGGSLILRDLRRPSAWQMPFLLAGRYLESPFSKINHQYTESLRGAYTKDELEEILAVSGLKTSLKVIRRIVGGHIHVVGCKPQ